MACYDSDGHPAHIMSSAYIKLLVGNIFVPLAPKTSSISLSWLQLEGSIEITPIWECKGGG